MRVKVGWLVVLVGIGDEGFGYNGEAERDQEGRGTCWEPEFPLLGASPHFIKSEKRFANFPLIPKS